MDKRSFKNLIAIVAVMAVALVAACGGGGDVFDDPISASQETSQNLCTKVHECRDTYPQDAPIPFEFLFGPSAEECIAGISPTPEQEQALRDAVDAGRTIYDADKARACNDSMLATPCDELWQAEAPECEGVFVGTVADGGACALDAECVSDFCNTEGACAPAF